jgi:Tfp pilus assembly protein PilV
MYNNYMTTTVKQTHHTLKTVLIIVIGILLIAGLTYASVTRYDTYKHNQQIQQSAQATALQEAQAKSQQLLQSQQARYAADVSRLVHICYDAQQRYDTLLLTQQIKTPRPDCTISQQ